MFASLSYGPSLPVSEETHAGKYRGRNETFYDMVCRIAAALSDSEDHRREVKRILLQMGFLPGGRVQRAVGSPQKVTAYNCLHGGTRVITAEYGVVEISSLAGKEASVLDGNGDWVRSQFKSFGEQELCELRLTDGRRSLTILATPDHDWIVDGERKPTSKLRQNDRIERLVAPKTVKDGDAYLNGIRHGIVYGDGTRNGTGYHLRLCGEKNALRQFFAGIPHSFPPSADGDRFLYFYNDNARADLKSLPDPALVGLDYLLGFIRGWIATDGCVSEQPEVTICCGLDEEEWLRRWGEAVGITPMGASALACETNFGTRNKESRNLRLDLRALVADDFLREKHRNRFIPIDSDGWRVASISEPVMRAEVFCAIVPTTHSFVLANGIHSGNCYVSGTIEDDSAGIMDAAKEALLTMRMGGGIGYDFSTLRPRGALIRSLGSPSSGPVSFMGIFDSVCKTVSSAGNRRGAQMGVLRIDHPDIEEFIAAKQNTSSLTAFNISVAATDEFMNAALKGEMFALRFAGQDYGTVNAAALWDKLMRSNWDWAEPGVLFIDRINAQNNLYYCETIAATNPCGEQPLPPYGACLLGSFNLTRYLVNRGGRWVFDIEQFRADIPPVVRAMDNVIDETIYPLPQQQTEAKQKRRMGLGVTGVANALEVMGHPYASDGYIEAQDRILETLRDEAYRASAMLAKEKGAFPLFDRDAYLSGEFISTLPESIRDLIASNGIRNSHLLSIAPTGTISLSADNISSGIEPVFSHEYSRTIIGEDGPVVERVTDWAYREHGIEGRTADELEPEDHVRVLVAAQQYIDSAVSKTCNVGPDVSWERFKGIYELAWKGGAKGCTTFRAAGKRAGILVKEDAPRKPETVEACRIDPVTGIRTCDA